MHWKSTTHSESGSTLVVAMMVMIIAAGLSLVVTTLAVSQNRSSGVDRQRTVGVAAAEAGIDATYALIQGSGVALPCSWTSGSGGVTSFPDPTQVTATVQYFAAGGVPLTCSGTPGILPADSQPASALINSTATIPKLAGRSNATKRTMQASVNLLPIRGNGFSKAIFGESTIIASNHSDISGSNLYTNGEFVCSNNQNYHGGIIAPRGSISLDGCSVDGDMRARGAVSITRNATIGGNVISSGSTVTLSGNTSVGGTVLAAGAISWPGCSVVNKCFANQASAAPPAPYEQFPVLRGDAAALQGWTDAGWTVIYDNTHCSTPTAFGDWVASHYAPMTGRNLVRTTCSVKFDSTHTVAFAGDLAIFASGSSGISTAHLVTFDSTSTTATRNLYLVVPYDAAVRPCASPGITADNQFGTTMKVNLLVYSPCDVSYSNNGGPSHGQVYSGSAISISNNFSLTFVQMSVYGIDPASLPSLSYTVDILYKREVPHP